jgi:CheY-like chemotaxis protein
VLEVSDTGHGIPLEVQPLLFEPFFTTKAPGKGTGLGLATCYGIVRQAGGRIEVLSEPGRGATFRVVLPATNDQPGLGEGQPAQDPAVGMPRGTETVLVAEDEPPVRDLATRMLGGMGYTVISGNDGQDALERARRYPGPIHLLVTDLVMPGMSGWQLSQTLRTERPGLRVLYISGYTEDSVAIEEALRHGDGFLAKPFSITDLVRRVREILDDRS